MARFGGNWSFPSSNQLPLAQWSLNWYIDSVFSLQVRHFCSSYVQGKDRHFLPLDIRVIWELFDEILWMLLQYGAKHYLLFACEVSIHLGLCFQINAIWKRLQQSVYAWSDTLIYSVRTFDHSYNKFKITRKLMTPVWAWAISSWRCAVQWVYVFILSWYSARRNWLEK